MEKDELVGKYSRFESRAYQWQVMTLNKFDSTPLVLYGAVERITDHVCEVTITVSNKGTCNYHDYTALGTYEALNDSLLNWLKVWI